MQLKSRLKELWQRKWYRRSAILLIVLFILFGPIPFKGLYRGRVVDSETGKPIAGALVVAGWTYDVPTVAGAMSQSIDAIEMYTDENGEFSFWGIGGLFYTIISQTSVVVYKVGYPSFGGLWSSYKDFETGEIAEEWIEKSGKFVHFKWGKAIVTLRPIKTYRELVTIGRPPDLYAGRKDKKPMVECLKADAEWHKRAMEMKREEAQKGSSLKKQ
jgi:hypothetical protein